MSKLDLDKLVAQFPVAIVSTHNSHGDDTAIVRAADLKPVMTWLKERAGFDFLVDVTAVDYLGRELRFEVVYHLRSMATGSRLRIKVQVGQVEEGPAPEVATVSDLWVTANWQERECFDLLGVLFVPSNTTVFFALLLNLVHFVVWFVAFWAILQFTRGHAFALTTIFGLMTMLLVLPLLFKPNRTPPQSAPAGAAAQRSEIRDQRSEDTARGTPPRPNDRRADRGF